MQLDAKPFAILAVRILTSVAAGFLFSWLVVYGMLAIKGLAYLISPAESGIDTGNRAIVDRDRLFFSLPGLAVIFGIVFGLLVWLATNKKNWTKDLFISFPIFLLFAPVTAANYIHLDMLVTRDAQALLNVFLIPSAVGVLLIFYKHANGVTVPSVRVFALLLIAFGVFAFVALPTWYSISYLSWKLGAGELDSIDDAAKALTAAGSLLLILGVSWKDGSLSLKGREKADGS